MGCVWCVVCVVWREEKEEKEERVRAKLSKHIQTTLTLSYQLPSVRRTQDPVRRTQYAQIFRQDHPNGQKNRKTDKQTSTHPTTPNNSNCIQVTYTAAPNPSGTVTVVAYETEREGTPTTYENTSTLSSQAMWE